MFPTVKIFYTFIICIWMIFYFKHLRRFSKLLLLIRTIKNGTIFEIIAFYTIIHIKSVILWKEKNFFIHITDFSFKIYIFSKRFLLEAKFYEFARRDLKSRLSRMSGGRILDLRIAVYKKDITYIINLRTKKKDN